MKTFWKKRVVQKVSIAIGITLILLGVNTWLMHDTTTRAESLTALQSEEKKRREIIESLARLKRESVEAQAYLPALRNLIPNEDQALTLQRDIRALAQKHALAFTFSFGAATPATETEPGSLGIQFTANGIFDNFLEFMREVEALPYILSIESTDLNIIKELVSATLRGKVFTR